MSRLLKILVFQHVEREHLGTFAEIADSKKVKIEVIRFWQGDPMVRLHSPQFIDSEDYKALIVLGGPMAVSAEAQFGFLQPEKQFIRKWVLKGKPYLGICLGAQLLAAVRGAKVYSNQCKEVGLSTVELTGASQSDRLFAGMTNPLTVFQWHGDAFDLPDNTVLLATNHWCINQAFRYRNAYGVLFHTEVTPAMVLAWSLEDQPWFQDRQRPVISAGRTYTAPDFLSRAELTSQIHTRQSELKANASIFFSGFLDLVSACS